MAVTHPCVNHPRVAATHRADVYATSNVIYVCSPCAAILRFRHVHDVDLTELPRT